MTEADRGAYTPHHDAPLAFDARRPSDRRPLPMTLIASAGVLALVGVALVLAYRGGVRGSESPKPVGEPLGAIKTAAVSDGQPAAAAGPMDVYAAQNVPTSAPNFAPPPEIPKARPAPAASAEAPAATGLQVRTVEPARIRIEEPAAATPTPAQRTAAGTAATAVPAGAADASPSRPVRLARAEPAPARAVAPVAEPAAHPAAGATASKTVPAVAKAVPTAVKAPAAPRSDAETAATTARTSLPAKPAKGGAAVQVGAFSSAALAQQGFADAGKLASLGGHARSVETVARDGKTFYRATLSGFADKAAAKAFCAQLAAKGGRCLVKS